jgi:hypothetical protein
MAEPFIRGEGRRVAESWDRKFAPPLSLRGGRAMLTLADARDLILALPEHAQRDPHWEYAAKALLAGARTARDVGAARGQLAIALKNEGLL